MFVPVRFIYYVCQIFLFLNLLVWRLSSQEFDELNKLRSKLDNYKKKKDLSSLLNNTQYNYLFIGVDDLRPDIGGFYGQNEVSTPNIERLMNRGVTFTHAYCQVSLCSPSRTSLLTGLRPDTNHIWTIGPYFRNEMPDDTGYDVITLTQYFKENGYYTTGGGKIWHAGTSSGSNFSDEGGGDEPYSWDGPYWFCDQFYNGTLQSPKAQNFPNGTGCEQSQECIECLEEYNSIGVDIKPSHVAANCSAECYPDGAVATHLTYLLNNEGQKRKIASQNGETVPPFFFAAGLKRPHLGWFAPTDYFDMYPSDNVEIAQHIYPPKDMPFVAFANNNSELGSMDDIKNLTYVENGYVLLPESIHAEMRASYYATITFMDSQLGRILDALQANEFENNTVIVFWGDHGYHLGEQGLWCKNNAFELDFRVPLVIRVPGINEGTKTHALVELLDIFPTLVDIAGLPSLQENQGKSLLEVILNPNNEPSFPQVTYGQVWQSVFNVMGISMRTTEWRYNEWLSYDFNGTNGPTPLWNQTIGIELYDHRLTDENDFNMYENTNLAYDDQYQDIVQQLHQLLVQTWDNPPTSS